MTSVSSVGTSMSPTRLIGLRKKERQLDLQIRKMEKRKDLIVKALKYKRGKESDKIEQLIQKWRTASQMASSYLLNSFHLKISAMGGISEWRKSIKRKDKEKNRYQLEERLEWLEKLLNSDQFSDLSSIEQQEIQDQIQDLTAANEDDEWEANDEDYEFTMEEMLKYLKLDYNLLYGS
ncbi:uncharacterized protein PRCAT00000456001 [Priceomyces carsonii]|uniref:uncharacterized protein n=1 Tax=Priceomyces carsonii TaxID=28549 RepID=UPI002ED8C25A|nr:unnamed protein product [Priceomyces carsonii]